MNTSDERRRLRLMIVNPDLTQHGGIQTYCRSFREALQDLENDLSLSVSFFSWKASGTDKLKQTYSVAMQIIKAFRRSVDVVIVPHINMGFPFLLLKLFLGTRLIVVCHGIEIWRKPTILKKLTIRWADCLWYVSSYTKEKISQLYTTNASLHPMPGCLVANKNIAKLKKLHPKSEILFVGRIDKNERYKGFDRLVRALNMRPLPELAALNVVASGNDIDYMRDQLFQVHGNMDLRLIQSPGDSILNREYLDTTLLVVPSRGEGLGLVFHEALLRKTPFLCEGLDGSHDACGRGRIGFRVRGRSIKGLENALSTTWAKTSLSRTESMFTEYDRYFSFGTFKQRLRCELVKSGAEKICAE